jgi:hypothetical protein
MNTMLSPLTRKYGGTTTHLIGLGLGSDVKFPGKFPGKYVQSITRIFKFHMLSK